MAPPIAPREPRRAGLGLPRALGLALGLALAACRGAPPATVDRLIVADSPGAQRLQSAGLERSTLEGIARGALARAPGFVPPEGAGRRARRYTAQLLVAPPELLATPGGPAIAQVSVLLELTPAAGGAGLQQGGRAAEPVGPEPGALRAALARAAEAAVGRAVEACARDLAAEVKDADALLADLGSGEVGVRLAAVRALGARREPRAVPGLIGRLSDPEPRVVEAAVGALAQLRDPRAVPALIELARHRDPAYQATLATLIGDIGGPDARDWLQTVAAGHPDPGVRAAARAALQDLAARPAASP